MIPSNLNLNLNLNLRAIARKSYEGQSPKCLLVYHGISP